MGGKTIRLLYQIGACTSAIEWAKTQPTMRVAWESCPYGDWMLWFAERVWVDRKRIVLAACDCVALGSEYWDPDHVLSHVWLIDSLRRWARGKVADDEIEAVIECDMERCSPGGLIAFEFLSNYSFDAVHSSITPETPNNVSLSLKHAAHAIEAFGLKSQCDVLRQYARIVRRYIPWKVLRRELPKEYV